MAFRVVRLRREARRNAKLEEIFTVRERGEGGRGLSVGIFSIFARRKIKDRLVISTWTLSPRYSGCMRSVKYYHLQLENLYFCQNVIHMKIFILLLKFNLLQLDFNMI